MKLKTIGTAINALKKFDCATSAVEALKPLSDSMQASLLNSSALSIAQKELVASGLNLTVSQAGVATATTAMAGAETAATGATTGLGVALQGLWATLQPLLVALATNPLTWFAAAAVGAMALEDALTLDYGEANENFQSSSDAYESEKSNLESLQSEYDTTAEKIKELQTLKNAGTISMSQEAELNSLKRENIERQKQINLEQKLVDIKAQEMGSDAKKAVNKKSNSVAQSVESGDAEGKKTFKGNVGKVTDAKAVSEDIKLLDEYNQKLPELQQKVIDAQKKVKDDKGTAWEFISKAELSNAEKELEHYQDSVATLQGDISTRGQNMQEQLSALKLNPEANVQEINKLESALSKISNMNMEGLSKAEREINNLDSYFSSDDRSGITSYIQSLADAGKSGEELYAAFRSMGGNVKGVSDDSELRYFNEMAEAAQKAKDSIEEVGNTLSDVSTAFESENGSASIESMEDYITKADELRKLGKTGTDDFETVANMIGTATGETPESRLEQNKANFEANKAVIESYMDWNDKSGAFEITAGSVQRFTDAFNGLGESFTTTGEAAQKMGMSASTFEAFQKAASDFDIDTTGMDNLVKSSEALSNGRTALDGLKELRKTLSDGGMFSDELDGWEEAMSGFESDITTLDPTITAKIEFAYDLAQLQQEMESAESIVKNGGSSQDYANLLGLQQTYNDTLEQGNGFDKLSPEQIPIEYTLADNAVANLQQQLVGATEQQKVKIQAEIDNITDIQNNLQEAFAQSEYALNINADSSLEETQSAWDAFLQTDEAKEITGEITEVTDASGASTEVPVTGKVTEAEDGTGGSTKVDATANVTDADTSSTPTPDINSTASITDANTGGLASVAIDASANITDTNSSGAPQAQVNATANVTSANTGGVSSVIVPAQAQVQSVLPTTQNVAMAELQASANVDYKKGEQEKPADAHARANYTLGSYPTTVPSVTGKANFTLGLYPSSLPTITQNVVANKIGFASGTMLSPAHASGTAYNMLNMKPAYVGGKVALDKNEQALINEVGTESIIRDGVWSLIPGKMHMENLKKGDIILSAQQTSDLLKRGETNSHARAFANGTLSNAYAGGIVGNISSINDPNREKGEDEFSEIFDHIEIWLDRVERNISNLTDSIEDYTENLGRQNSIAQDAINQTKGSLGTLQSAYETYMAQANAVGLEDNWKNVVNSGEIRISEITDEGLKQRIDDYKKYYDQALDVQDKIYDSQRDLLDLANQKLSNIEDYYQNRYDYNDDFGYSTDIEELRKALGEYKDELANQMDAGIIKQYSDSWYKAQEKIAQYISDILNATWDNLQYVVDGLERVSDRLDNINSLEEAKGNKLTEGDYQSQIDTNNKSIQAQYNLRNSYLGQMAVYDVGSKEYQDLADKVSKCDDEVFKLREDNEELKDSIWELRFTQPLDELKDKYSQVIDEVDQFRDLMDDDSFVAKDGSLTDTGLANIVMIMQGMNASKQITADYTAALKKLDEALQNNIISQSEYDEQQKDILETINDSVGTTEDYKNELIDIYRDMAEAEVDSQDERISKQKEYMDTQRDAYEYSKKIQGQSKSANQLRAQIAALTGTASASAQAELKRLQQQLAEQEEEIADTKKDHEYTVRIEGLDDISDSLSDALDKTLDELTYNADMQESVVKEMLSNVVNAYGSAYDKINRIINNTGFQFGYDNSANIGDIGDAAGSQNQYNQATTTQPNATPDKIVSDIDTGAVNENPTIDNIVQDISKPIDTTNRKVAELTLNRNSLSIQEGGTASLSVAIRPTDAKNKQVVWSSSNPAVATVSGGSISAKKPGATTITASSTDGSGKSASCGVTVTEKPKPAPPTPSWGGGDGLARVGDVVTLSGSYFYDSWGQRPAGHLYSGVPGGVVIDAYSGSEYGGQSNFHGGHGVHIKSADGRYGDLGWVRLDQLTGYAKGTKGVHGNQLALTDEDGQEIRIDPKDGIQTSAGTLRTLPNGTAVIPHDLTENLYAWGEMNPKDFIMKSFGNLTPDVPDFITNISKGGDNIDVHYDSLLTVNGDIDKEVFPGVKKICEESWKYVGTELLKIKNR